MHPTRDTTAVIYLNLAGGQVMPGVRRLPLRIWMSDTDKEERWRRLRDNWRRVETGMTLAEVEEIMGFHFNLDSENEAGRVVYSHHTSDYLPFYLVLDRASGRVSRKHDIRALDEM